MGFISRTIEPLLLKTLQAGKSVMLLGARQTGKTTLLKQLTINRYVTLADPSFRQEVEKNNELFKRQCISLHKTLGQRPLIVVDEVQKAPKLMDVIQYLIDEKIAQFILTGSSARKLKKPGEINLLPGRAVVFYLDPFSLDEYLLDDYQLTEILLYGNLPEIMMTSHLDLKERLLQSYALTYLEEEVRAEALVRNLGHFAQFLQLAAIDSGKIVNFSKISQEIGVAHTTIQQFYQILEDCLVAFKVEAFIGSNHSRKILKSPKYLFFDMGVKRICAHESLCPAPQIQGYLFEHFIGLELIRFKHISLANIHIKYWRSYDGVEVDWIAESAGSIFPIEVKSTTCPTLKDARHLLVFLQDYPLVKKGYIVCLSDVFFDLSDQISIVPWKHLSSFLKETIG